MLYTDVSYRCNTVTLQWSWHDMMTRLQELDSCTEGRPQLVLIASPAQSVQTR